MSTLRIAPASCGVPRRSARPATRRPVTRRLAAHVLAALIAPIVAAAPPNQRPDLVIPPPTTDTLRYGESVAAHGGFLAVTLPNSGDAWTIPGAVDVLRISTGPMEGGDSGEGGDPRSTLRATVIARIGSPRRGDHFGASIALRAWPLSPHVVVAIGADDAAAMGTNGPVPFAGVVDLYTLSADGLGATLQASLAATTAEAGSGFGGAIALDLDARTLAVGARRSDAAGAIDAGGVHVFSQRGRSESPAGDSWIETQVVHPPRPEMSGWFGSAVALGETDSGTLLAIGAPGEDRSALLTNAGAVHLYLRAAGETEFLPIATVGSPVPSRSAWFGAAIALDGPRLIVGEPRGIALDPDGGVASGTAWIFDIGGDGQPAAAVPLVPPRIEAGLGYGQSVALLGDLALVGAPGADERWVTGSRHDAPPPVEDAGIAALHALDGTLLATLGGRHLRQSAMLGASVALVRPHAASDGGGSAEGGAGICAALGHLFVEEESLAPSPGVACFNFRPAQPVLQVPSAPPRRARTTSPGFHATAPPTRSR